MSDEPTLLDDLIEADRENADLREQLDAALGTIEQMKRMWPQGLSLGAIAKTDGEWFYISLNEHRAMEIAGPYPTPDAAIEAYLATEKV